MDNNNLICEETSESWIIDNNNNNDDDLDVVGFMSCQNEILRKDLNFMQQNRSIPVMGFVTDDDDCIKEMVDKEIDFKPGNDYLKRLSCHDFEFRLRNQALDWIWKACVHHHFGPLCIYLSMNYFDRFLTSSELPKDKDWAVQLLAVSCLSLAAKMEETYVPQSVDLQFVVFGQVEDPKFVFEAKTIKRMELLVLNSLNWRMKVVTPFSFIDYFVGKLDNNDHESESYVYRSTQLILNTTKEVEFLDFRASEIAAAIAITVSYSGDTEEVHIEKALSSLVYVKQERVAKCLKMMRELSNKISPRGGGGALVPQKRSVRVPESPNGVLEAICLSYKSDDITTIGSCTNSSHSSPNNNGNKRRKQQ